MVNKTNWSKYYKKLYNSIKNQKRDYNINNNEIWRLSSLNELGEEETDTEELYLFTSEKEVKRYLLMNCINNWNTFYLSDYIWYSIKLNEKYYI